jgi:fucose 4-O-acetylase-like acetyltransferase
MEKKYVIEYDILRILLTILVVIGHGSYYNISFGVGGVKWEIPFNYHLNILVKIFRWLVSWIYTFHMPFFILLSGMVAFLNKENNFAQFDELVIKKIKRLIMPFLLCGVIYMLPIKLFLGGYTAETFQIAIKVFLLGQSDLGHLWFLLALFWCFVIFFPLYVFYRKYNDTIFILLVSIVIYYLIPKINFDFFGFKLGMQYLVWFVLGFSIEHYKPIIKSILKNNKYKYLIFMGGVLGILNTKYDFLPLFFSVLVNGIFLYSVSLFIANKTKFQNTWMFNILSKNNMDIYLFHDPLNFCILYFAFRYNWLLTFNGCFLYIFLRTIGVIVISLLISVILKNFSKMIVNRKNAL